MTQYQYDAAGRQTQVVFGFGTPEAKTWGYSYLATNQVETVTKPDASTATHGYDNRGRLVTKSYSDAANADTFSYYGNSLLKTAVSGIYGTTVDRTAAQAYDEAGRLLAEVQDNNGIAKTVSYAYTQDSLLDTITYPSGRVLHQTYTTKRELDAVQLDGGAVASHVYDNAGRLTQRNYGNGKVANWTLDANSRMTEVEHVGVQKYGYTYSDEGDPLTQTDLTTPVNHEGYTYDGMHRLATMNRGPQGMPDFSQSWSLDQVGNWTSWNDNGTNETRTHNALNQLTQKGTATCVYDGKGNQVDDGEKFVMVYDPNNRLKEVRDRATGETVVTCKYDALGRRVERNVLRPVEYQTGGITRYYYAGQRIVEEYDGNALLQAVYTYGQYIDEPLSMDHVPTSQPTSQPASGGTGILPVTETTATPEVVSSPLSLVTPTATALPSATLNSELLTQNSPIPSVPTVPSVVNTPFPTETPFYTPTILPSPTVPADPFATMATEMLTPVPTDTPVALQTAPPDPYATQAAQMVDSSTPLPEPTVAQVQSIPQVITSPTPTGTPVQTMSATSQPTLERYYYHTNRLYNVAALTDSQGNVVERYQYNAYGLCTTFNANYELPLVFSRFGNPFTYTGRELDPETDLMLYRDRTYNPKQGRFVQTDPIGYQGGINLYEYVGSRCLTGLDPNGQDLMIPGVNTGTDQDKAKWLTSLGQSLKISWEKFCVEIVNKIIKEQEICIGGFEDLPPEVQQEIKVLFIKALALSSTLSLFTMQDMAKYMTPDDPYQEMMKSALEYQETLDNSRASASHWNNWGWTDVVTGFIKGWQRGADGLQSLTGVTVVDYDRHGVGDNFATSYYLNIAGVPLRTSKIYDVENKGEQGGVVLNDVAMLGLVAADAYQTARMLKNATNPIQGLQRTGSALKNDPYHAFPNVVDNFASSAAKTQLQNGASLYQVEGSLNGVNGRFEWIVDKEMVTHRMFVPGGIMNGVPIKP